MKVSLEYRALIEAAALIGYCRSASSYLENDWASGLIKQAELLETKIHQCFEDNP